MLTYYIKLGLLSIRKNPVLSALMIAAIAVGIGACMTIVTINYIMGGNPIPHKSDNLYYVQLDSWDPDEPAEEPNEPPRQVTYIDATALLAAGKASRQVVSYRTVRVVEPEVKDQLPFTANTRSTTADFFAMFDVPFLFGSGWDKAADDSLEQVAVLSRDMNEQLFGGENSVGKQVTMNGEQYRVTGVLDNWIPVPKYYDVTTGAFNDPEEIYFPFSISIANEVSGDGNTNCWKPIDDGGFSAFLNSECVWMQMWVELNSESEKTSYLSFMDAYVDSQKLLGRFPRPLNNRLSNVEEWLINQEVVDEDAQVLLGLAILFLIVCLLNTIGLLLAKIMRRAGEIGLRRALGATKGAMFSQQIVEAGIIGLSGGILGVGMTWLGLRAIERLFEGVSFIEHLVSMDWVMVLSAVILAIVSALLAALYPTWRACNIQPASQIKAQ